MSSIKIPEYSNYPIPYLNVEQYLFNKNLISTFSKKELLKFNYIPLDEFGKIITICVANPSFKLIKQLEKHTEQMVRIFWCTEEKIIKTINKLKDENKGFYIEKYETQWKANNETTLNLSQEKIILSSF